jgi:hypothetical protein
LLIIVMCAYGIYEILDHCATNRCGRWQFLMYCFGLLFL